MAGVVQRLLQRVQGMIEPRRGDERRKAERREREGAVGDERRSGAQRRTRDRRAVS